MNSLDRLLKFVEENEDRTLEISGARSKSLAVAKMTVGKDPMIFEASATTQEEALAELERQLRVACLIYGK